MTARWRGQHGTTTIELALMLPLVLVLLIGSLDLARAMNAVLVVSSASREGARYAVLHPMAAPSQIVAAVVARSVPLDPALIAVAATYDDGMGPTPWPDTGLAPSEEVARAIRVRVDVTYPWSAATFFTGSILGRSGIPLASSSRMEARW